MKTMILSIVGSPKLKRLLAIRTNKSARMCPRCFNFKVFNSIIILFAILMMYIFRFFQIATYVLLHYKTMFHNIILSVFKWMFWTPYPNIAMRILPSSSSPEMVVGSFISDRISSSGFRHFLESLWGMFKSPSFHSSIDATTSMRTGLSIPVVKGSFPNLEVSVANQTLHQIPVGFETVRKSFSQNSFHKNTVKIILSHYPQFNRIIGGSQAWLI